MSTFIQRIIFLIILIIFYLHGVCQFVQERYSLIIDTDCGADDLRAISMLLAIEENDILGMISSDGALAPSKGAAKIKALLSDFDISDIPVAEGSALDKEPPPWREYSESIIWGKDTSETVGSRQSDFAKASSDKIGKDVIAEKIIRSELPVDYICLGPMTNLAEIVKQEKDILRKINRIIWYNRSYDPLAGTNYERDSVAVNYIMEQEIRVDMISNLGRDEAVIDQDFISSFEDISTSYAAVVKLSFKNSGVIERIEQKHLKIWDDLVPVYLLYPDLFDMKQDIDNPHHRFVQDLRLEDIKQKIPEIIAQEYVLEKNIVFTSFPDDMDSYRDDVKKVMQEIIDRHGREEWKICVITNEMHRHLGIYSIVGAKMGLKAREILDAGIDRLEVVTFAGNIPPLSCLNDGLQVSTGATVGQGTIRLSDDKELSPAAIFTYDDKTVKISLKPEYIQQVESDINEGIVKYGNLTDGYWKLIRKLAIKYWLEWSRDEIFEID